MLPGSIYYHFPSKEEMLLAVYEEGLRHIAERVDAAVGQQRHGDRADRRTGRRDRGGARGRFGGPIGVEWPDGRAACLVAIRGVQWEDGAVALAAGGGVIARSQLDREWDELALKRTAVKGMLGL